MNIIPHWHHVQPNIQDHKTGRTPAYHNTYTDNKPPNEIQI